MRGLTYSTPTARHSVAAGAAQILHPCHAQPCGHTHCQVPFLSQSSKSQGQLQRRKLRLRQSRSNVRASSSVRAEHAAPVNTQSTFRWATNVSRHGNVYFAIDETSQACRANFGDPAAEPTVAVVFASSSYSVEFDRIIPVLRSKVPSLQHIVGCTVCPNCVLLSIYILHHVLELLLIVLRSNKLLPCFMTTAASAT